MTIATDDSLAVTNAGTFATQVDGAALTALQLIDNIVHVDDAAFTLGTSSGVMIMGFAGTQSVNANDAAALACDTDGALHISDGGNAITVDNGGTFAVQSTLQANSGVDVGDVDVLTCGTITPGTAAGNLGKAVDAVAGASDTGVAMLAVRDDELAAQAADADYVQLRADQFGRLRVTNMSDTTIAVQFGVIDAASSGDNTLQAAAGAGKKIKVLSLFMVSAGTVTARFESGAGGTALTGQMNLVANSGFTLPFNPEGWFETGDNALLNLELSGAVSVDGCFTYVED